MRNPATVVASHPASRPSTSAALPDGARADDRAPIGLQGAHGPGGDGGLAGAGGADDQHQLVPSGDGPHRLALGVGPLDRGRADGVGGPVLEVGLLVEDPLGGHVPVGHRFGDGPPVPSHVLARPVPPGSARRIARRRRRRADRCGRWCRWRWGRWGRGGWRRGGPGRPPATSMPPPRQRLIASATICSSVIRSTGAGPSSTARVRSGSNPTALASPSHWSCRVAASMPWVLPGREASTARRSRVAMVRGSGSVPSCSADQARISRSRATSTWAVRFENASSTGRGRPHDVGVAADHRPPLHAEAAGELGAEGGAVDPADAALLALQEPGIERQPPAGGVLDLAGDDRVGVQLRVHRPRRVLTEHRHRQALGVDLVPPRPCLSGSPPHATPGSRGRRRRRRRGRRGPRPAPRRRDTPPTAPTPTSAPRTWRRTLGPRRRRTGGPTAGR